MSPHRDVDMNCAAKSVEYVMNMMQQRTMLHCQITATHVTDRWTDKQCATRNCNSV